MAVVGCLRVTAREPGAGVAAAPEVELWLARVGAVGYWAATIALMLLPRVGVRFPAESSELGGVLMFVLLCVAAIGLLGRLRRLALRLPDPALARGLLRDAVIVAVAGALIAVLSHRVLPTGGEIPRAAINCRPDPPGRRVGQRPPLPARPAPPGPAALPVTRAQRRPTVPLGH